MKKIYYTTKLNEKGEEVIDRVQPVREGESPLPETKDWKLWNGTETLPAKDTPLTRYDLATGKILSDDEWCAKQGKKNPVGFWYNKTTQERTQIYAADATVDETEWTQDAPIENEPYQKFDNAKKKWVVDTEKKERSDKESRLGKLKSDIEDAERRQIRPMKAIIKNEATADDTDAFNRYEEIIQELRPQVSVLENELKSA
jgi:polyhydroxyalkanoate synthesis regulator phasin